MIVPVKAISQHSSPFPIYTLDACFSKTHCNLWTWLRSLPVYFHELAQETSNSFAEALELLFFCTKSYQILRSIDGKQKKSWDFWLDAPDPIWGSLTDK